MSMFEHAVVSLSNLFDMLIQFRYFIKGENSCSKLLKTIVYLGLHSIYPNVYFVQCIFPMLPETNGEEERIFVRFQNWKVLKVNLNENDSKAPCISVIDDSRIRFSESDGPQQCLFC